MISSYTSHMDPNVWNTGTNDDPHPIDEFWAERFLVHPTDPSSGPLKKAVPTPQEHAPLTSVKDDVNRCVQPAEGPRFSTKGLSGIFIPYGSLRGRITPLSRAALCKARNTLGFSLFPYGV